MGRASRCPQVVPRFDWLEVRSLLSGGGPSPGDPGAPPADFVPAGRLGRPEPAALGTNPVLVAVIDSGVELNPGAPVHFQRGPDFLDLADAYDAVAGTYGLAAVADLAPGSPGTRAINNVARGISDAFGAGGSPAVRIVPIRAFDPNLRFAPPYAVLNGIYHAVDLGARVIQVGYVGDPSTLDPGLVQQFHDALAYARSSGVAVVVAAGNGYFTTPPVGQDIDRPGTSYGVYPADAHLANMLVVTSADASGRLTPTSNWGAVRVDIAAAALPPGGDTGPSAGYAAGVAAVLAATRPDWSGIEVVNRIKQTARAVPALAGRLTTGGLVDAAGALGGGIRGVFASRTANDFEGDLKSDLLLYGNVPGVGSTFGELASIRGFDPSRPATLNNLGAPFGGPGSIPVPGRYYGGGFTEPALLIPQLGPGGRPIGKSDFAILGQDPKGHSYVTTFVAGAADPGEIPVAGNFVGSGRDDLALYGIHGGQFNYKVLTAASGFDPTRALYVNLNGTNYGGVGSVPVVGDFFGEGVDSLGIYGPEYTTEGRYTGRYAFAALDPGSLDARSRFTRGIYVPGFGGPGDIPIAGNFDGDAKTDVGLYGRFGNQYGFADLLSSTGFDLNRFVFVNQNGRDLGGPGSVPVAGDFFGNGVSDPAIYGPGIGPDGRPDGSMTFTALDPGAIDARSRFTRSLTVRNFGGPGAIAATTSPGVRYYQALFG